MVSPERSLSPPPQPTMGSYPRERVDNRLGQPHGQPGQGSRRSRQARSCPALQRCAHDRGESLPDRTPAALDVALLNLPAASQGRRPGHRALAAVRRAGVQTISPALTQRLLPKQIGPDMLYHCSREMNHLAAICPTYTRRSAINRAVGGGAGPWVITDDFMR